MDTGNLKKASRLIAIGLLILGGGLTLITPSLAQDSVAGLVEAEHKAGRFNGLVTISLDGRVVESRSAGAVLKSGAQATTDTPWRLASISKQIIAVLVMMSVERGELRLDARIGDLLPAYAALPSGEVTIKSLLQHTSGLPDPSETPLNADGVPQFYLRDTADHSVCMGPPRSSGSDFHYNNCDYYVLADVLESVTGTSFANLLRDRIARPLALTSLHLYRPAEPEAFNAVDEHGAPEPHMAISSYEAAGGMSASASDLVAFDQALMDGRLLSPESLKVLWNGDPSLGYVALGAWSYTVKPAGCPVPMALVERRGAIGDVQVLNLIWPDRRAALVVFSNTAATDWGQLWQDSGFMRNLAVAAWCQ